MVSVVGLILSSKKAAEAMSAAFFVSIIFHDGRVSLPYLLFQKVKSNKIAYQSFPLILSLSRTDAMQLVR